LVKRLAFLLMLLHGKGSQGQANFQQKADHIISVAVNEKTNTLEGKQTIRYHNRSGDSLHFIWFHIWPNAYKNDRTAFSEQLLRNGRTDFYFSGDEERGYINQLSFSVDKKAIRFEDHPLHQDIIKLLLPYPLAPGANIEIENSFHVKLPYYFSRSGRLGNSLQATQWYPKPAVFDHKGWHPMPYLDQGEFFSEFGDYKVSITINQAWTIAATGQIISESTKDSLKTWTYAQDNIHDFAFFASPEYTLDTGSININNRDIQLRSYHRKESESWKNSIQFLGKAIASKSSWIGEYPYAVATVVELPQFGEDGMEYPTITLISNPYNERMLETLINHEVGHNWFYGILASNERQYPWMDEGMNSYYDRRYASEIIPKNEPSGQWWEKIPFLRKRIPDDFEALLFRAAATEKKDQPVSGESESFSQLNYSLSCYYKASIWMQKLEKHLGRNLFDSMMQQYFLQWKFRHPYLEDFRKLVENYSKSQSDSLFVLLDKKGMIENGEKKKLKLSWLFSLKETDRYQYISLAPLTGYNHYDGWTPGILLHNYSLPLPRVRFFLIPQYATYAQKLRGAGGVFYRLNPGSSGAKLEIGISAATYSADLYTDSTGRKTPLTFNKWVPILKYSWPDKGSMQKSLQWKTFGLREQNVNFKRDTVNKTWQISYPFSSSVIHQLSMKWKQNRTLYPWQTNLMLEHGGDFGRINVEWNGFFNYQQEGGLSVRLFAGKFLYWQERTNRLAFLNSRYHLNMTGPRGNEDYTYSDYFIGRNEFEGIWSQQIMQRDGGFKVRTDLLSKKIGKTDNWLAAINLSTTVPDKYNPLSLMPVKIPIRLFADFGTYADVWKKGAVADKLLYDAGLQLTLMGGLINIYAPLLYSREYREYINSTVEKKKLLRTISFSINIRNSPVLSAMPNEIY